MKFNGWRRMKKALPAATIALMITCATTFAMPEDGKVVTGSVSGITDGTVASGGTINVAANSLIDWQKFNIGTGETLNFAFNGNGSLVINHVIGNDISNISSILGTLTGDESGHIMLINPNGIVVGAGANINVGELTLSTLNVGSDFLKTQIDSGNNISHLTGFSGKLTGDITIKGNFTPNNETNLYGKRIEIADGVTVSGSAINLVAADKVTAGEDHSNVVYEATPNNTLAIKGNNTSLDGINTNIIGGKVDIADGVTVSGSSWVNLAAVNKATQKVTHTNEVLPIDSYEATPDNRINIVGDTQVNGGITHVNGGQIHIADGVTLEGKNIELLAANKVSSNGSKWESTPDNIITADGTVKDNVIKNGNIGSVSIVGGKIEISGGLDISAAQDINITAANEKLSYTDHNIVSGNTISIDGGEKSANLNAGDAMYILGSKVALNKTSLEVKNDSLSITAKNYDKLENGYEEAYSPDNLIKITDGDVKAGSYVNLQGGAIELDKVNNLNAGDYIKLSAKNTTYGEVNNVSFDDNTNNAQSSIKLSNMGTVRADKSISFNSGSVSIENVTDKISGGDYVEIEALKDATLQNINEMTAKRVSVSGGAAVTLDGVKKLEVTGDSSYGLPSLSVEAKNSDGKVDVSIKNTAINVVGNVELGGNTVNLDNVTMVAAPLTAANNKISINGKESVTIENSNISNTAETGEKNLSIVSEGATTINGSSITANDVDIESRNYEKDSTIDISDSAIKANSANIVSETYGNNASSNINIENSEFKNDDNIQFDTINIKSDTIVLDDKTNTSLQELKNNNVSVTLDGTIQTPPQQSETDTPPSSEGSGVTADSMPEGGTVVTGKVNGVTDGAVTINNGTLEIAADSLIDWQKFNIGTDKTLNFAFNGGSLVINHVIGNDISNILGTLIGDKDGHIMLINPNGIVVGAGANINVGELTLSTLNVGSDYLKTQIDSGNNISHLTGFSGKLTGDLTVKGNINALNGAGLYGKKIEIADGVTVSSDKSSFKLVAANETTGNSDGYNIDSGNTISIDGGDNSAKLSAGGRIDILGSKVTLNRTSLESKTAGLYIAAKNKSVTGNGYEDRYSPDNLIKISNSDTSAFSTIDLYGGAIEIDNVNKLSTNSEVVVGGITLSAQNGTAKNGTYDTTGAQNSIKLSNIGTMQTKGGVLLNGGSVSVENVTGKLSGGSYISVVADKDVTLKNIKEMSADHIDVSGGSTVTLDGVKELSNTAGGDLSVASKDITINDSTITAVGKIDIKGDNKLTINDSNLTASTSEDFVKIPGGLTKPLGEINIESDNKLTINDSNLTAGHAVATSGYETNINNSDITAKSSITIDKAAKVTLDKANLTTTSDLGGYVDVYGNEITAKDSAITANKGITIDGTKKVTLDKATLTSQDVLVYGFNKTNKKIGGTMDIKNTEFKNTDGITIKKVSIRGDEIILDGATSQNLEALKNNNATVEILKTASQQTPSGSDSGSSGSNSGSSGGQSSSATQPATNTPSSTPSSSGTGNTTTPATAEPKTNTNTTTQQTERITLPTADVNAAVEQTSTQPTATEETTATPNISVIVPNETLAGMTASEAASLTANVTEQTGAIANSMQTELEATSFDNLSISEVAAKVGQIIDKISADPSISARDKAPIIRGHLSKINTFSAVEDTMQSALDSAQQDNYTVTISVWMPGEKAGASFVLPVTVNNNANAAGTNGASVGNAGVTVADGVTVRE